MRDFAKLLDKLYFTPGNLAKAAILHDYLRHTPDPDRGWAVASIAGELSFDLFKRKLVKDLVEARIDPVLFTYARDYVGEMSETVAHLWPAPADAPLINLPSLTEVITHCHQASKEELQRYLVWLLDHMTPSERWALLKLGTRGLRIGISARSMKQILADYGAVPIEDIESLWHGLKPPYIELLQWLDGNAPKPDISDVITFSPVMLSHPLEESDFARITPEDYVAEWKYDGIRIQLIARGDHAAMFSRTGDEISHAFPDVMGRAAFEAVLDGELVARQEGFVSFQALQQRLNRKSPTAKTIAEYSAELVIYDALELDNENLRPLPFLERRARLEAWMEREQPPGMQLSPLVEFASLDDLEARRHQPDDAIDPALHPAIEGVMLKRKDSPYVAGRPKGHWYKFKRNARLVDAVMMYAQRGHGKRSSFYSDYTFGLWQEEQLLPIGKAYSGFTDQELKELDKWVRHHTTARFGPVREVSKELVLEVAFDAVQESARHKSGLALRFPRIHRIRWDKPAAEADRLETLRAMIT